MGVLEQGRNFGESRSFRDVRSFILSGGVTTILPTTVTSCGAFPSPWPHRNNGFTILFAQDDPKFIKPSFQCLRSLNRNTKSNRLIVIPHRRWRPRFTRCNALPIQSFILIGFTGSEIPGYSKWPSVPFSFAFPAFVSASLLNSMTAFISSVAGESPLLNMVKVNPSSLPALISDRFKTA